MMEPDAEQLCGRRHGDLSLNQRDREVSPPLDTTAVPPPESQSADYELAGGDGGVDRAWYLQTYPDIERAGVDPVEHYLWTGWRERRDPRPDFSTSRYLEANKEAQGNPLLHYLRSAREAHWEEIAVTDWYRFWKKGLLHPKRGQEPLPTA